MWRVRSLVVLTVVAAVLLLGTAVAYAGWGWWWNATIDVEGVEVHTAWAVVDDPGGAYNYSTRINMALPKGAQASVIDYADNETVRLTSSGRLECHSDGVEAMVTYKVKPVDDAVGEQVEVAVVTDEGTTIGEGSGEVGKMLRLRVFIPVDGPSCAAPD